MSNMPFRMGQWLLLCDRCKFKRYADQVQKTWDGLIVCKPEVKPGCFEPRHPQDFVRAKEDDSNVPFARPRPTDQFVSVDTIATTVGVQETTIPSGNFNSTDPN